MTQTPTGQDFLKDFELLEFGDGASFGAEGAVNLAILEGAKRLSSDQFVELVELYVAYFDRAPDALGLLFWANALADGVSMREIAELFFDQPETQALIPAGTETKDGSRPRPAESSAKRVRWVRGWSIPTS